MILSETTRPRARGKEVNQNLIFAFTIVDVTEERSGGQNQWQAFFARGVGAAQFQHRFIRGAVRLGVKARAPQDGCKCFGR